MWARIFSSTLVSSDSVEDDDVRGVELSDFEGDRSGEAEEEDVLVSCCGARLAFFRAAAVMVAIVRGFGKELP